MENQRLVQVFQEITQKVNALADGTGQKVEELIQNDDTLRPILVVAHSRLPLFIRIVLKQDRFVNFVMQNRAKLLIHREINMLVSEMMNKLR